MLQQKDGVTTSYFSYFPAIYTFLGFLMNAVNYGFQ